jgi:GNAT superfamily N-acetyltransferase
VTAPAAPGLAWTREERATWDDDVARVVGGAPGGVFDLPRDGAVLPGDWFAARGPDGRPMGYGWLEVEWGDAEVLLAVDPAAAGAGVGGFVLDHLEQEAVSRGVNYVYNTVRPTHPRRDEVTAWLESRGYRATASGDLRKRVTAGAAAAVGSGPVPRFDERTDRGPGDEESGGYVDAEDHRY